ncbi:MAG: hypothetical protein WCT26_05120 [Candidatus Buchananbacteria bacterium]|jgi:hypothetical protein
MAVLASTAIKEEIFEHLGHYPSAFVYDTGFEDMDNLHEEDGITYHIFMMDIDNKFWKNTVEEAITKSGHKFKWL